MHKQPNWSRLERERFNRDMQRYESQLRDELKRCEECDKVMGDEEQCQRICELCSAGVPCDGEDLDSEDWQSSERPINRPSELGM